MWSDLTLDPSFKEKDVFVYVFDIRRFLTHDSRLVSHFKPIGPIII